jgi:hypothetical protein
VTTTTTPVRTTTSTTRPAPARATAPVSASNFYQQQSPNWSGYAVGGGPFSSVAGTFSIPSLGTTATCDQELGEWVGVDGQNAPNLPPDPDLIQAGIGESLTNPVTGSCTPGQFWFWSWWEVLPAPAVPVELPMSPGDKVSVTISQLAGGTWGITLHDDTDGQEFNTEQPYSGHGSSSEWIVEAPVDPGQCGAGEAPGDAAGICALAPFSPVEFSDLKMSGRQSSLYQIDMWQGGDQVATPSGLSGGGFAVNYSGPLASLTAVAHNPVGGVPQGNFLHPVYYQPRSGPYEHN